MGEFRIAIALLLILIGIGLVRILPPYWLVWGVVFVINLMNLLVSAINIWQAWKQDKRFLHAGWLGAISVAVGVGLTVFFIWFGAEPLIAELCGLPWVAGGVFVLVLVAIRAVRDD